ncbi:MAG: Rid family hydrolase, partial [Longimicrobiales bacterium]|nr:Rid family hydrolase [Longimicrobiales bacterium]
MIRPHSDVVASARFAASDPSGAVGAPAASTAPFATTKGAEPAASTSSWGWIASAVTVVLALMAFLAGAPLVSDSLEGQEKEVIGYRSGQPFSAAVRAGNTVYFSGRLGLSQEVRTMEPGAERVREEVRLIMESFREIFEEAGVGFEDVVKATVFITDLQYYDALNEVYLEYFPEDAPARAAVEVS